MLFAIYCRDRPDSARRRADNRPAHLDYLKSHEDHLFLAGPILSDDGTQPVGSLLIVECADREEAEVFAANDPYNRAGVFDNVAITPFRKVIAREGG